MDDSRVGSHIGPGDALDLHGAAPSVSRIRDVIRISGPCRVQPNDFAVPWSREGSLETERIARSDVGDSAVWPMPQRCSLYRSTMKRHERLGHAMTPSGTLITLYRHDGAYL